MVMSETILLRTLCRIEGPDEMPVALLNLQLLCDVLAPDEVVVSVRMDIETLSLTRSAKARKDL